MSRGAEEYGLGTKPGGSLRDDLASLRIERGRPSPTTSAGMLPERRAGGGGRWFRRLAWLVVLGAMAGGGYYGYLRWKDYRPKVEVSVALVQTMTAGEAEKLLSAKGYIKAQNQASVGTRVAGRISELHVREGMKIKKGDLIAALEHNDIDAALEMRRAMVTKTEAEVLEARAGVEEKRKLAARQEKLLARGQTSAEEVDKAVAARAIAEAREAALKANILVMEAQVREIEESLRNMEIRAPFDATVITKDAEQGETISPMSLGAGGGRSALVTLADLTKLDVETDVTENLLSKVAIGQPAEFSVGAVPGRHYRGRLRAIIPMGDRTRGTIKVKVEILDPDDRLFPELACTVHFLPDGSIQAPDEDKPSLFVAKSALVEEAGHTYAWVVDPKSRAVARRLVEVVVTNDDLARVEQGLAAGEQVVVDPPKTLREADEVTEAK